MSPQILKQNLIRIFLFLLLAISLQAYGQQEIPILDYSTDANGNVQLEVASSSDHYYILKARHGASGDFHLTTSMTMGAAGKTTITEPLGAYPQDHYQVLEFPVASPGDNDGDGKDDISEYNAIPTHAPINAAEPIDLDDGVLAVNSLTLFKQLAVTRERVQWAEYLNGKSFVKYLITDYLTDKPKIYFIDTEKHPLHKSFGDAIGVESVGETVRKGELIYHPTTVSNNGTLGTFTFGFSNGHGDDFEVVQNVLELLAANMPLLKNNLSYFVTVNSNDEYDRDKTLYQSSRVPVLLEADVYAEVDYWALNVAEGFGFFRKMNPNETPGVRDVVLYESLPNELPRVGGIMTSAIQSPLSHVNLRAIQDQTPNAFIRNPLEVDSIANLLDEYVYYKVEQGRYIIRQASLEEVNAWFEDLRPAVTQIPPLDLSHTAILALDDIQFDMADGFGAKCANVATMRTFGFPEGTIPNGFGVPFYFYQEFMEYNDFFEDVEKMLDDEDFKADRNVREDMLKDFRDEIKDANMPPWMLDQLEAMHLSFPEGTSVRCRSSTNNEDLPGFSGAGLYDSKTQHPDEGHISKSIKQVYASLWNLQAFDERDFFRIDHYAASMGVLCHPNFKDELANGVGVSTDPLYQTSNTFYLNSQLGEDLITNPDSSSVAEEILIDRYSTTGDDYTVIRRSNLVPSDSLIIGESYLDQMRDYLTIIHDEFAILYDAVGDENFAMDIEYKITSTGQLSIKQARPWVSYRPDNPIFGNPDDLTLRFFPNPIENYVYLKCDNCGSINVSVMNIEGRKILDQDIEITGAETGQMFTGSLPQGMYIIRGFVVGQDKFFAAKLVKH